MHSLSRCVEGMLDGEPGSLIVVTSTNCYLCTDDISIEQFPVDGSNLMVMMMMMMMIIIILSCESSIPRADDTYAIAFHHPRPWNHTAPSWPLF